MAIDWNFIEELEGNEKTAYIPMENGKVIGKSGITIGTGIDLGYQSKDELKKLGVSDEILNKLDPYFGKTEEEAKNTLDSVGAVTLSDEEVSQLNTAIKSKSVSQVKDWYNNNNKVDQDWSDLTDRQQTVVSSVLFQYGMDGAPKFKSQIEQGDWDAAVNNLSNFTADGSFQERRDKEIQYLQGGQPTQQPQQAPQSPQKPPERPSSAPQQPEQGQPTNRLERLLQRGSQALRQGLQTIQDTSVDRMETVEDEEKQVDVREKKPSLMDRAIQQERAKRPTGFR